MTIPGRIGMTARRGRWPHRWWCALRRHRWTEHEAWTRVKIADGPWRLLKDSNPVHVCGRCGAAGPWESDLAERDLTLDRVLVR